MYMAHAEVVIRYITHIPTLVHTCTLACLEYDGAHTYIHMYAYNAKPRYMCKSLLLLLFSKEERFKVHTCITLHYIILHERQ